MRLYGSRSARTEGGWRLLSPRIRHFLRRRWRLFSPVPAAPSHTKEHQDPKYNKQKDTSHDTCTRLTTSVVRRASSKSSLPPTIAPMSITRRIIARVDRIWSRVLRAVPSRSRSGCNPGQPVAREGGRQQANKYKQWARSGGGERYISTLGSTKSSGARRFSWSSLRVCCFPLD